MAEYENVPLQPWLSHSGFLHCVVILLQIGYLQSLIMIDTHLKPKKTTLFKNIPYHYILYLSV